MNAKCLRCGQDGHFAQECKLPVLPDDRVLAVPLLTEPEIRNALQSTNHMVKNAMHGAFWPELEEACRAIESLVRSKLGARAPMTDAQIAEFQEDGVFWQSCKHIVRDIEKFHGIVGKEGGNAITS